MAIKINNKNLARRVINWQDVQRVILNWSQIRPTGQPHIDYHVISNRGTWGWGGWGWIPWWWGVWWSTAVGESGITNWWDTGTGSQWTANLKYNWLPSLLNAYKVEIIYSFYWNQTETYNYPFESFLEYNSSVTYESTINKVSQERLLWLRPFVQSWYIMRDLSAWDYVMTAVLDLENESATLTLEWPNWFSQEIEASLTSTQIFNIRHSTDFWVILDDGVRLSRVDFFVYNNPQSPSVWAWIYHNATLWLISYSLDWENWITIADKDLWASAVYWQGLLYQWWNNYWWSRLPTKTSDTQVNASDYGPWNYYYSDTYIKYGSFNSDWDSSGNNNLWWWVTNTDISKQWPCPEWYHIPTTTEFNNLADIVTTLVWSDEADDCRQYFLINEWNTIYNHIGNLSLFSADDKWVWLSDSTGKYVHIYTTTPWNGDYWSTTWLPIRPFKNTYVVPDSTRTVLYQPQ